MTQREYDNWIRKINILINRKNSIKVPKSSGSSWHDYSSSTQSSSPYRSKEEAEQAKSEIDEMISEILHMLNEEGYNTDSIMKKYNGYDPYER